MNYLKSFGTYICFRLIPPIGWIWNARKKADSVEIVPTSVMDLRDDCVIWDVKYWAYDSSYVINANDKTFYMEEKKDSTTFNALKECVGMEDGVIYKIAVSFHKVSD